MKKTDQIFISAISIPFVVSVMINYQEAATILGLAPSFALLFWFFRNHAPFGKEITDKFLNELL